MNYSELPLWVSLLFMFGGLAALAWSSDRFVAGAASLARSFGVSPFIVGMVIIGFGTSAPELCVSALSGASGHSNISLGNAYGSCAFNIAVILGVAAMIRPLTVRPGVTFVAGILLTSIAGFSIWLLHDGDCTRHEALILIAAFAVIMPLYCWLDQITKPADRKNAADADTASMGTLAAAFNVLFGLAVLIGSSHLLVWGAVDFARLLGVSDLMIGLTIIAVGTSLPELASAIASARRGENEFVLGNIIGSNIFNTLAVVGIATAIGPLVPGAGGEAAFSPYILSRDLPFVALMSLSITLFGVRWSKPGENGRIGMVKGILWLAAFVSYTVIMILQEGKAW